MTERLVKGFCKLFIDNNYGMLTSMEKELLKMAVDESRSMNNLAFALFIGGRLNINRW